MRVKREWRDYFARCPSGCTLWPYESDTKYCDRHKQKFSDPIAGGVGDSDMVAQALAQTSVDDEERVRLAQIEIGRMKR